MPASSKEFVDIKATIECGFILKRVRDMVRTYSQKELRLNQVVRLNSEFRIYAHISRNLSSKIMRNIISDSTSSIDQPYQISSRLTICSKFGSYLQQLMKFYFHFIPGDSWIFQGKSRWRMVLLQNVRCLTNFNFPLIACRRSDLPWPNSDIEDFFL